MMPGWPSARIRPPAARPPAGFRAKGVDRMRFRTDRVMTPVSGRWRLAMLVVAAGALIFLPACWKLRMKVIVNPDASGKIELVFGLKKKHVSTMQRLLGDEALGDELVPEEVQAGAEGIVAWTGPEEAEEGEFTLFRMTGYFEDINKVALRSDEESPPMTFSFWRLEDGSYTLTYEDPESLETLADEESPLDGIESEIERQLIRGLVKTALGDLEVTYRFRLPGDIAEAAGFEVDGREAWMKLDADKMLDLLEDPEAHEELFSGTIRCRPEGDLGREMAAFREEMERAMAEQEGRQVAPDVEDRTQKERKWY